jgi:hypothetical protein
VFVSDKQAKDGETKRWWVESNQTWQESDAVAKHINAHVDQERFKAAAEYSAHNGEPTWDVAKHWQESPNAPGAGVDAADDAAKGKGEQS